MNIYQNSTQYDVYLLSHGDVDFKFYVGKNVYFSTHSPNKTVKFLEIAPVSGYPEFPHGLVLNLDCNFVAIELNRARSLWKFLMIYGFVLEMKASTHGPEELTLANQWDM